MAPQTIPELDLLSAIDSSHRVNSNSWPEFELTDVDVYDSQEQRVSLLGLSDGISRTLVGQLEPLEEDQIHLLKTRSSRRAPLIKFTATMPCSFELDTDNELVLRAAGQAGWYELQPSTAYQSTWSDMTQAIKMFGWIVNAHKQRLIAKKRVKQPYQDWPVEQLFESYGFECFGRAKMAPEAAQRIFKHKEFLLECMLSGKAGVEWTEAPLYLHFAKKFPKQLKAAKTYVSSLSLQGSARNALPIRSSSSKRKRDESTIEEEVIDDAATIDASGRPAVSKRTAATDGRPQYPATPKTNAQNRRRYATKGMSALRPSAVRPDASNTRQEVEDADSDTDSSQTSSEVDDSLILTNRRPTAAPVTQDDTDEDSSSPSESEDEPGGGVPAASSVTDLTQQARKDGTPSDMDIWQCTFTGCSHKITAASQPDLQVLTEEHVALHAYDNDARVQLVQQLEHASLPVSHLMERVRLQARADQLTRKPQPHSRASW